MNTNHWMEQKLNDEHQRQMREVARREQVAQESTNEAPVARPKRRLLSKLHAEMSQLAARWEQTEVASRKLQRQS